MRQRVETLEQSQRQNPLSIELLVNSAKRLLAKPEYRIQLEELFAQETTRLIEKLDSSEFELPNRWDQSIFRSRIGQYEAATEALASMVGVLGRWGDDSEFPLVFEIIRSLYSQAERIRGGLVVFPNIRSYPAVLVFTAYGLGLTRAERWSTLHRLFDTVIDRQHAEPLRIVGALFLQAWKGSDKAAWNQVEGLEKHKTPFSDHLVTVFTEWGKNFVGMTSDFELVCERFEMLGSLAHLEQNEKLDVQQELAGTPRKGWARMPVGRVGWHSSNADKLVSELQSEPMRTALTSAGFAKGDAEFLDLFVDNFQRIAARMQF